MATKGVLATLEAEFEAVNKSLKDVDENIKRLTGRDPEEYRSLQRRQAANAAAGGAGADATNRFPGQKLDGAAAAAPAGGGGKEAPANKRRNLGSAFSRLGPKVNDKVTQEEESAEEDELPRKHTVQSSVVAANKDSRTRKDTMAEQKGDRKNMERNKRMFGMIVGTLQKFQSEETKRKVQAQKRAEIEQKLEEAAEREKEELKKERQDLFVVRREKQAQIRRLEQKMEIAKIHDLWEAKQQLLLNFIHTKTKPPIMYKPVKHTADSQRKLKESQKRILAMIEAQRLQIKEELAAVDEMYRKGKLDENTEKNESGVDKENHGPYNDKTQYQVAITAKNGMSEEEEKSECFQEKEDEKEEPKEDEEPMEEAPPVESEEPNEIDVNEENKVRENATTLEVLGDQGFEPIYDE